MTVRSVCVYCASGQQTSEPLRVVAREMGLALAAHRMRLVYGGASIGMMGEVADSCLAAGGKVTGVIPESLEVREVVHETLTELIVTPDMHSRKMEMFERSDAFVSLPGGVGTLEETLEIITWKNLGIHLNPIVIVNHDGFYDPLLAQFDVGVAHGVIGPNVPKAWQVVESVKEVFAVLSE